MDEGQLGRFCRKLSAHLSNIIGLSVSDNKIICWPFQVSCFKVRLQKDVTFISTDDDDGDEDAGAGDG